MRKPKINARVRRETEERLRRLARAASVLVDGDAFKAVPVDPAINTGDDYRVDHEKFIAVKKTLMKIKRLEDGDAGIITWRRFKDQADITVPVDSHPCAVRPGNHPITPAMAEAFEGRTAVQELDWPWRGCPILSVCAPIRDSMDDVVGVVEVFASLTPDRVTVDMLRY
ncbi:MAG TPA: hypothetical protein PK280_17500 [Planctomycetota bacterium]|nr:hypothetical protein [Planctomycetota bacterium]